MTAKPWYSQLFENGLNGGVLLAIAYESLASWGDEDDYDEMIDEVDQFLLRELGPSHGLFVGDDDGVHEAHWLRLPGQQGATLVVWSAWHDPARPSLPENAKEVAKAWERGQDPRQAWLEQQLQRTDLVWTRQEPAQHLASGVLLLMHAEGSPLKARFAKPRAIAKCGQCVPLGLPPGDYAIETTEICELPDGENFCLLARWVAIEM